MTEMKLGPNGGLVYAMEYLVDNIDWLEVVAPAARERERQPPRRPRPPAARPSRVVLHASPLA